MNEPSPTTPEVSYGSYLALDQLLGAQRPLTGAHDELLFIVIHQVYELWFKELLHEGARLRTRLAAGQTSAATRTVQRMRTVVKTIVGQVDVLETMLPADFRSFRGGLGASSGFQSAQFRELEVLLGRRDEGVLGPHPEGSAERAALVAAMALPSLMDCLLAHLAAAGFPVPEAVLARDVRAPAEPSAEVGAALAAVYAAGGGEAALCEALLDLDEGLMEWRYRHVQMVRRMIGGRPGTGGSAGADYLASTLLTPAFPELWAVRSAL